MRRWASSLIFKACRHFLDQQKNSSTIPSGSSCLFWSSRVKFASTATNPDAEERKGPEFTTFYAEDLIIERAAPEESQPKPDWENLTFGHHFSDHMLEIDWSSQTGWKAPRISPLHDLHLHPAAKVLHYAIELFEGIKAYRGVDNKIRIFRPDMNMKRMIRTAQRACLPSFDGEQLLECIEELVRLDQEWVPYSTTSSLYIRPTFIGTEPHLGVSQSNNGMLFVVTGPVGPYFKESRFNPVALYADPRAVRAWTGGVGSCKMGSNYAPTILIGKIAQEHGCQQALWLYGPEEQLTEVGTMNIFTFWINEKGERELVTPPLEEGLILPGVTRDSILTLTREWNEFKVSEKTFTMGDIRKALVEDRLLEIFGAGTACIVSPVDRILYRNGEAEEDLNIPTMKQNSCLMQRLFEAITDIQYGRKARQGWTRQVT